MDRRAHRAEVRQGAATGIGAVLSCQPKLRESNRARVPPLSPTASRDRSLLPGRAPIGGHQLGRGGAPASHRAPAVVPASAMSRPRASCGSLPPNQPHALVRCSPDGDARRPGFDRSARSRTAGSRLPEPPPARRIPGALVGATLSVQACTPSSSSRAMQFGVNPDWFGIDLLHAPEFAHSPSAGRDDARSNPPRTSLRPGAQGRTPARSGVSGSKVESIGMGGRRLSPDQRLVRISFRCHAVLTRPPSVRAPLRSRRSRELRPSPRGRCPILRTRSPRVDQGRSQVADRPQRGARRNGRCRVFTEGLSRSFGLS